MLLVISYHWRVIRDRPRIRAFNLKMLFIRAGCGTYLSHSAFAITFCFSHGCLSSHPIWWHQDSEEVFERWRDGYLHLGISVAIQHTNAYLVFYLNRLMDISRYVKINTPQRCASYLNKYSAILIFFFLE